MQTSRSQLPSGMLRATTASLVCGILFAALLWIAPAPVLAQAAAPASVPVTQTLASALRSAAQPRVLVVAVDAENTLLPRGSAIPERGSSVESISKAVGRTVKQFGSVTAIAPPTMILINSHPADGNPFFRLSREVFRTLLASLDDACWQDLTSDRGLGVDDLPTIDQQKMFVAFIPAGSLRVGLPDSNISSQIELPTSAIVRGRLRLTQQVQVRLPSLRDGRYIGEYTQEKAGAPRQYEMESFSALQDSSGALGGVTIQDAVPNAPKPGQLNFKDARFAVLIPLQGVRTLGKLIERIGQQTRTELYADHRLGNLSVTVLGGRESAPAAALLRA
ncbi:MAG: hypothetical protein LC772_08200, partial [Chloroflexi bacterium]|nr:hypothetical protein [Chloroflexota bacterium]